MKPGSVVIYFDTKGEPHNALVTAVNPLDPQEIDLCIASEGGPLPVVMNLAIRHASTKTSGTHCWCEPVATPVPEGKFLIDENDILDLSLRIIKQAPDLEVSPSGSVKSAAVLIDRMARCLGVPPAPHETRQYADGSSASGPGPLPELSPDEQKLRTLPIPEGTHEAPGEPGTLIVDGTEPKAEAAPGETGTGEQAIGDSNQ